MLVLKEIKDLLTSLLLTSFPFCHIFSFWIIYIPAQQKDCTKIFRERILLENGLVLALPLAPERPKHAYRKSSIKPPPPELIYFKPMLGGGLKETGSLFERGVYLEKTMVSVLHKEIQSEKAQEQEGWRSCS